VALSGAMVFYDLKDASLIATLPYQRDVDRWGELSAGLNAAKDRFYVRYQPSVWIPDKIKETMPSYLDEMSPQGQVLRSFTLPPQPESPRPQRADKFLAQRLKSPALFFGTMIYQKAGALLGNISLRDALSQQFTDDWEITKQTARWITVLSTLFAGFTLWWARRIYLSWQQAWAWAGIAFAFNLAGFLIFRLAVDWPVLVPCPACRESRPIDRESCPLCGQGWPEAKPNGTEIFEHSAQEVWGPAEPV
jgi:hypothetical protein